MKNNYAYWYNLCFKDAANDAAYIEKFCDNCGEGIILEPGSGTGRLASHLKNRKIKFLEVSGEMIEIFLKNHPDKKDDLIAGSADNVPLPDNSVSGIYVPFNGIGELTPIVFTLKEFHRVLKDDGKLLICAANPDFPMLRAGTGIVANGAENGDFQFDGRTFKTPFGKYSWQTMLSIRTLAGEVSFSINQYLITRERLEQICCDTGFQVESVHGSYDSSAWSQNSQWTLMALSKNRKNSEPEPDIHMQKLTSTYNTVAPAYNTFAEKGSYAIPGWLKAKLPNLKLLKPDILDLGCANGNLGEIAAHNYGQCDMVGVDVSPVMISELRKRSVYKNSMVWDLNKGLPFIESEFFDLVFAFGVLEFIKNIDLTLSGIAETLKPTGSLLCSFECFDELKGGAKVITDPRIGFPRYLYTEEDVKTMLRRHKLEAVSSERITAYKSPSTGAEVQYVLMQVKRDRNLG